MVISGLLVNTLPEKLDQVKKELSGIRGVEINSVVDDYRIVVVMEAESVEREIAVSNHIAGMDGVLSVNLAYHNFEEEGKTCN